MWPMTQKRNIQTNAFNTHSTCTDYTHPYTHNRGERATGFWPCQPHFTAAYHGQMYPACGQPLLMLCVNTTTSLHGPTNTHTHSLSAIQHLNPVTGLVINGVWALDMTALLSLCDKEPHTATLFLFRLLLCPFIFPDFGLLSSHLGISLWKSTLA